MLRTKHIHTAHCQEMAASQSLPYVVGMKKASLLNSLSYFHTTENFSVDVMHDILEGVGQYELKLLILYFKEQHVALEELNSRIQSFDYGFMERNNGTVAVNPENRTCPS